MIYSVQNGKKVELMPAPQMRTQNLANFLCAVSLALYAGVSAKATHSATCQLVIPRHRQEFVKEFDGVTYINDSKATNIHAVQSALSNFDDKNIVLLLGGSDKGEDFVQFLSKLPNNVKCVIAFGEMCKRLSKILKKNNIAHFLCEGVYEAVNKGREVASWGDVVLFSPGGASFDEFSSFEERGDYFCELVNEF